MATVLPEFRGSGEVGTMSSPIIEGFMDLEGDSWVVVDGLYWFCVYQEVYFRVNMYSGHVMWNEGDPEIWFILSRNGKRCKSGAQGIRKFDQPDYSAHSSTREDVLLNYLARCMIQTLIDLRTYAKFVNDQKKAA